MGFQYQDESWDERRAGEDRRTEDLRRQKVILTGSLFVDGANERLVVTNVSETGLAGRTGWRLTEGDRIQVAFGSAPRMAGLVVWVKGDRFGLRFDEPIVLETALPKGVASDRLYEELERRANRMLQLGLQRSGHLVPERKACED